jgi:hypothetical protein
MNRITAQSPANRLPLYPQHRTFRGPRWTSGFDPERTFANSAHISIDLTTVTVPDPEVRPEPTRSTSAS